MSAGIDEYKTLFAKMYRFMEKHIHAKTDHDWESVVRDMGQFTGSFEVEMAIAIIDEIERAHKKVCIRVVNCNKL